MRRVLPALFLLACPLCGDGGVVLTRQESGPFAITVFTAGASDWSVLVQERGTLAPVLDATVSLRLSPGDGGDGGITVEPTHAAAQNKLLYAAQVNFPRPGDWKYEVTVRRTGIATAIAGVFVAAPPPDGARSYWFYFAVPVICVLIFTLHQWLSRPTENNARPSNPACRDGEQASATPAFQGGRDPASPCDPQMRGRDFP
jgi:hypothetical protein